MVPNSNNLGYEWIASFLYLMPQYFWASSVEASNHLGISESTLNLWREIGYLKEGTHWRFLNCTNKSLGVIYHLDWCQEEMEYWKSHHALIQGLAA